MVHLPSLAMLILLIAIIATPIALIALVLFLFRRPLARWLKEL
jgi:hypothetical protein